MESDKPLIIGIGNVLMTDDGVGPYVISLLEKIRGLPADLLTLDTPGFALLTYIQNRDRVIIVDAASFEGAPGEVRRITPGEVARKNRPGLALHDADPFAVIDYAEKLGMAPRRTAVYAVRFGRIAPGGELTANARAGAEKAAAMIAQEISSYA